MWGAPVNLIRASPPLFYSEWNGAVDTAVPVNPWHVEARFTDYEMDWKRRKPRASQLFWILLDWACVNRRKMEEQVWPDPQVVDLLTNDVVLVSLYVDERKDLPESERREESMVERH